MTTPSKELIIKGFIEKFRSELSILTQSAKAAHAAATHEESKAEDRHDTFAIEASYLAAGQAVRVADLEKTLEEFEGYLEHPVSLNQVRLGALITYELDQKLHHAFFSKFGGGSKIEIESIPFQVLTLLSPLGEALEGTQANEEVDLELRGSEKTYRIISVD